MKKILLTLTLLPLIFTVSAQTADTTKKAAKTDVSTVTLDSPVAGDPKDAVYTSVEQIPQFPGGMDAFSGFLTTNLRYPKSARKNKIQGRVIVTMVVEKDGSLSNIKIARSVSDDIDAEALRVVKLSPKWSPGIQNGRPVKVSFAIPISFMLDK